MSDPFQKVLKTVQEAGKTINKLTKIVEGGLSSLEDELKETAEKAGVVRERMEFFEGKPAMREQEH